MSSKLTSLLQYRFVKKDTKSPPGSQSSDTETLSPSQTSTQPPVTPTKHGASSHSTPEPDSPIFGKSKLPGRNLIHSPSSQPSSSTSSPWLSKENGVQNGTASKKPSRKYPMFSDEEVDSKRLHAIPDYSSKLQSLQQMFPARNEVDLQQGLIDGNGDVENAIDIIIGLKSKNSFKRIRTENHDSVADPDTPVQPRKRIRMISSDTEEELDSQTTVSYGLESQRSDATEIYDLTKDDDEEIDDGPFSADKEQKIKFLMDCFRDKPRKEIVKALTKNDWIIADATVSMSNTPSLKSVTSEQKERARERKSKQVPLTLDDDEDEEEYGNESDASEDSIEDESTDAKSVIVNFFNDASPEELIATPGCSKKKTELIISERPFKSWEDMTEKFLTIKGLSYDLISGCREAIKIREVIIRLMQRCERMSSAMEDVVSRLTHSASHLDDENYITKQPNNLNPDLQLKPFQMVGLNWLRIMHSQEVNGILADEMGLGKTIQTIAFLAHLLSIGEEGPHCIIVPSSTIDNWIREAKRWCPSLKVLIYYGSQEDRRATRQHIMYNNAEDFHVIITTYNMVAGSVEDRALFKKFEFLYAIFDEGHLLKNMSSLRYQNLMKICAHRRLLLTGTPLQNNLLELMSLLCFVMPDMFIGKTEQLKRMFTMITRSNTDERTSYEQDRIAHAKRIMKPFVLRRLKSEVMSQLPKKKEKVEYCTMIPSQQEVYEKLISKFTSQLNEETYTSGGAGMLMQLRKAANHPLLHRNLYDDSKLAEMAEILAEEPSHKERGAMPKLISEDMQVMSDFEIHNTCKYYKSCLSEFLLDESLVEESGKFRLLDETLHAHKKKGHRVLLFSQFTSMMDIMEIYLKRQKMKYLRLDGSTPVVDRQRLIDEYTNDDSIYVFLLSTKAGGLGINLTAANVVILHDIDFNPYNDKQAEDRCHRVGQTREVQIVRLISKDSVEEAMLKCAQEKLKLEQDVISTDVKDDETGVVKDVASILKQALTGHDSKHKS